MKAKAKEKAMQNRQTHSRATKHIERRDYGTVVVRTPREGVKIEQLLSANPEKGKTK